MQTVLRLFLAGIFVIGLTNCSNRLNDHHDEFLDGQPAVSVIKKPGEVRVTYLGTSGYLIESGSTCLVVDPYFSRHEFRRILLKGPIQPIEDRISNAVMAANFPDRVDAWLVTHAHFDHMADVPFLQKQFGGKIIASQTGCYLAEATGTAPEELLPSTSGTRHKIKGANVRVVTAMHDLILGVKPYPGQLKTKPKEAPARVDDWVLGEPLAFIIEIGGKKIYVESGGMAEQLPPEEKVDLAIIGVATRVSQDRFPAAVKNLQAPLTLPTHQDSIFKDLDRGFFFGVTSDFPRVKASWDSLGDEQPGRMILMDYFETIVVK